MAPDLELAGLAGGKATYFDGHYGALVVFAGAVPESGDVVLTGGALPSSFPAYTVNLATPE